MAKTKFTNTERGARGIYDSAGTLHMVEPGQSVSIEVTQHELKDVKANKQFAIGGVKDDGNGGGGAKTPAADEGPLTLSVAKLKEHLDTVEDVEALKQLGKDEAAGQNRSTALDAIQARIDELEKPAE